MDLSQAAALVTGGGTGIGRAVAAALVAQGARVAISGRRQNVIEAAAKALSANGQRVVPIVGDVSREDDAARMVETTIRELGSYDTLINNAGIGAFAPLVDTKAEDFRKVWETNVLGAMLVARASARHFITQNRGNIVNVASTSAHRGGAGSSSYASTKFALTGLTECWRAELRQYNIRVMQVNPSEVVTDFFVAAGREPRAVNPTKLVGEDIAHVVVGMLALSDRGFVTDATVWATNPK